MSMTTSGNGKKELEDNQKRVKKDDSWITIEIDQERFSGQYNESENGKYIVAFQDGHMDSTRGKTTWINGEIILIEDEQKILWKKELERPNNAHVSNDGIVAVEDRHNPKELCGSLIIFNIFGNKLMEKRLNANIGASNISPDGINAVVTTCKPENTIYMFEAKTGKLIWEYKDRSVKASLGIFFNNNKISFGTGKSLASVQIEYELTLEGRLTDESERKLQSQKSLEKGEMKIEDAVELIKTYIISNKRGEIRKGLEEINKLFSPKNLSKKKKNFLTKFLDGFPELVPRLITMLDNGEPDFQMWVIDILVKIGRMNKDLIMNQKESIIRYLKANPNNFREGIFLGSLGEIDLIFADVTVPILKDNLINSPHWNARRFSIFNLELIGKKYPEKIKDIVPKIAEYIENPEKTEKQLQQLVKDNLVAKIDMSVATGMNVDPKTWIRDAAIDFMGGIGKNYPELIKEYIPLLEKVSTTAQSPYTVKKAKRALETLRV